MLRKRHNRIAMYRHFSTVCRVITHTERHLNPIATPTASVNYFIVIRYIAYFSRYLYSSIR